MKRIVLASTSSRRKELLEKTGLAFDSVHSSYEEDMSLSMPPKDLAKHLSMGKAQTVANLIDDDALVIGADTFIFFEDKVIGKPHTKERSKEILRMFSGKPHDVITGFTIIDTSTGRSTSKAVESKVYFKKLSEEQIDRYVATGEPLDKAGAYGMQGLGGELIEKIEGDPTNIIGLPMKELIETLKDFGINV
jgi:septum formation protein